MSAANPQGGAALEREVFPVSAILMLILVGVVAFCGFVVLAAYAPELRARSHPGAHALSSSAVGYRGAGVMLKALGVSVRVSRAKPAPHELSGSGLVLTPQPGVTAAEVRKLAPALRTLIVLPKWDVGPDPVRPGFVRRIGYLTSMQWASDMLAPYGRDTQVLLVGGLRRPVLHGADAGPFGPGTVLPLGPLDGLQTIKGPGWTPLLVDEEGHVVLASSKTNPTVAVLAEPDLLNNQGLGELNTARAGMAILQQLNGRDGVVFDVTLNGLARQRSLGRLALEPPWVAATLCVLVAAALMGWQAAARFGAPMAEERAIALGAAALVDNSAGLIRMARKEAALAPAYAESTLALVAQASGAAGPATPGASDPDRLARAAERRGLDDPRELSAAAGRVRTRDELMAIAERLYRWRLEMTRERS